MSADNVKPWITGLKPYSPGKTVKDTVKLASNENSYGPSPTVVEGLRDKAGTVYRYPYRDADVKNAVSGYCGVKPENIVLGNGSDELIDLCVKTFKGPAASHYPTFVQYPAYAKALGEEYVSVPLDEDFGFDGRRFLKEAGEANLVFLCTPNNPTGTTIPLDDVKAVAESGKVTVVDEAYFEFHGETAVDLIGEYDNVVVLRTLAKAFGLAGLRFGYGIGSPEAINALHRVKPPFNVNVLAHEAALLALDDIQYMRETVEKIKADRERVAERLAGKYRVTPSATNFLLVDVSPHSTDEFFNKMLEQRIVVRQIPPLNGFPGNWVRITIGTSEECGLLLDAVDSLQ